MSFASFSGSHPETQPLFSIEQAELIRRLRNSGITKEQVVQAFESFDRIDEDLGTLYTIPKSLSQMRVAPSLYTCQTTTASSSTVDRTTHNEHARKRRYSNGTELSDSLTSEDGSDFTAVHFGGKRSSVDGEEEEGSKDIQDSEYTKQTKRTKDEPVNVVMKSGTPIYNNFRRDSQKQISEKLQRQMQRWYLKRHEMSADFPHLQNNDMRKDLSDSADMNGVPHTDSQAYQRESQFLYGPASSRLLQLGSASHISQSMLSATASIEHNASGHLRDIADEQKQAFMRENPMLIKPDDYTESQYTPRRERFTFREKHLEILEAYFKINQYPISDEREMIAKKCNAAMAISTGRELDEKERVTNQNVQNWFNNRRKEIKKLARAEGIDYSEVSLPSRLRPRLDFSECFNMSDYPWSYDDKPGKDLSYSSYSMVGRQNVKSPLSEESHKLQTQTNMFPTASNHAPLPVSQSEATAVDQSETSTPTVEKSPPVLEPKIKQEIVETNSSNNETST